MAEPNAGIVKALVDKDLFKSNEDWRLALGFLESLKGSEIDKENDGKINKLYAKIYGKITDPKEKATFASPEIFAHLQDLTMDNILEAQEQPETLTPVPDLSSETDPPQSVPVPAPLPGSSSSQNVPSESQSAKVQFLNNVDQTKFTKTMTTWTGSNWVQKRYVMALIFKTLDKKNLDDYFMIFKDIQKIAYTMIYREGSMDPSTFYFTASTGARLVGGVLDEKTFLDYYSKVPNIPNKNIDEYIEDALRLQKLTMKFKEFFTTTEKNIWSSDAVKNKIRELTDGTRQISFILTFRYIKWLITTPEIYNIVTIAFPSFFDIDFSTLHFHNLLISPKGDLSQKIDTLVAGGPDDEKNLQVSNDVKNELNGKKEITDQIIDEFLAPVQGGKHKLSRKKKILATKKKSLRRASR